MIKATKLTVIASAAAFVMLAESAPANAQFLGVFQGAMSVLNQATGKLGSKLTGADKPTDLEAERTKFYGAIETQSAGLDANSKQVLRSQLDNQWANIENTMLMRNAQLQHDKSAPLIDLKKVATDTMGGMAVQMNINSVIGGSGMTELMQGAAMNGIIDGVNGRQTTTPTYTRATYNETNTLSNAVTSGATTAAGNAVGSVVSNTVSGAVGQLSGQVSGSGSDGYEITEANDPSVFFGKSPTEFQAKDLYRENGFLGYKHLSGATTKGTEAYAPVAGDDLVKAAVFNYDPTTGKMNAAFRVLKATQVDFMKIVAAVSKKEQAQPRFASQGSVLRAVWENGVFVAADPTKVSAGWSSLVSTTYQKAPPAVAMN